MPAIGCGGGFGWLLTRLRGRELSSCLGKNEKESRMMRNMPKQTAWGPQTVVMLFNPDSLGDAAACALTASIPDQTDSFDFTYFVCHTVFTSVAGSWLTTVSPCHVNTIDEYCQWC